jgi:hypothetical protein
VGTREFVVTAVALEIVETNDPGSDCPESALRITNSPDGVTLLGKDGDPANDNSQSWDLPRFRPDPSTDTWNIVIAPGDYEDVRVGLRLNIEDSVNCDENEWDVAWTFTVN